jgi:hypothetical protein
MHCVTAGRFGSACGLILAVLAAAAIGGCASGPTVKALKAERVAWTDEAAEVRVTLELTNPNDAPVELTEWEYTATVNGRAVYQGLWMAAITLPVGVPMTTELPVVISAADMAGLESATWSVGGSVGYRATRQLDRLLYQLGINRLSAGFQVNGQAVPVAPRGPAAAPGS